MPDKRTSQTDSECERESKSAGQRTTSGRGNENNNNKMSNVVAPCRCSFLGLLVNAVVIVIEVIVVVVAAAAVEGKYLCSKNTQKRAK